MIRYLVRALGLDKCKEEEADGEKNSAPLSGLIDGRWKDGSQICMLYNLIDYTKLVFKSIPAFITKNEMFSHFILFLQPLYPEIPVKKKK